MQLQKLLKASSVYQLPDLAAIGNGEEITLVVRDKKNDNSNEFALTVGKTDKTFEFNFKIENIKLIPGSYDVVISKKLLSKFTNSNYNLDYYIALNLIHPTKVNLFSISVAQYEVDERGQGRRI